MNFSILLEIYEYRRRTFILIAVLLIGNLLLYGIYLFNRKPALDKAIKQWTELRKNSPANDPRLQASVIAKQKADLASFRVLIPEQGDLPAVLGDIFRIVADNNLKAASVTYNPMFLKEQNLWEYAVKMTVEGSYIKLKKLLDGLQRADGMLVMNNFSFRKFSDEEDKLALNISLTFYLRETGK